MLHTTDAAITAPASMVEKINAKLVVYQTQLSAAKNEMQRQHVRSRIVFWLKQAELAKKFGQRKN